MTKVEKKDFWGYFIRTFKSGKYLLVRYLLSSVLYIVITVISNLLEVKELTYLNAFLSLNYFSAMLSFGVSGGILVFVNQNIDSKDRVSKYVRSGSELNLIISTIFTIFLVAFPRFFMETITGYVPDDYTFYYIMCVYFFISCIYEYLCDIIQNFELFKMNLFVVITPLVLTIVAFLILYFAGSFYLNLIAIMYVITQLAGMIFAIFCVMRNNKFKINIFKPTPLNLTSRQWKLIVSTFCIEFIWEVGYYATSVALLRADEGIFNTYSYLEYVLDIFNGFLFTFTTITSIRITRAMGYNKFNEAYKHAKYSIYATLIIWVFYAVTSMILIYPIALGVNDAYFELIFTALPSYVFIHIFRFLGWTFCSYMLKLGGKTTALLIMEIISTLYLIALCFFIQYLPQNVFLIYIMVSLNEIVPIPIYFYMFKSKKWMANVNEDPKLLSNKVKVFIFDFDGTLYYDINWSFWDKIVKDYFDNHFSYLTEKEKVALCKRVLHKRKVKSDEDLCKILFDVEGNCQSWLIYRDECVPLSEEEKNVKLVPIEEIKKFIKQAKEKNGGVYIVSNSTLCNIKEFCEYHNFDLSIFDDVIVNDFKTENPTKQEIFERIMHENNAKPDEVMVIGDSYNHDIKPAKNLKMNYYHCKNGFSYDEAVG